ncbi:beta-lactamase family protein [Flavihumibacter sp. R14]|nr:beta-lactamase family protein [Flavihumibacter soli]
MKVLKFKILLILVILSARLQAQTTLNKESNSLTEEINSYLISAVEANKFNGVALIAKDGKVIFHKAYGWRNVETRSYNDTLTVFPILSITKSFTAMVILKLQEQKKLAVSDKLNKYLPDFPNEDKITIANLITHTSGIHNFTDDIGEEDSALVNHPVTKQFMLDFISKKPFDYPPGEGFGYNNSGFYLAGLVIEKVTGKSYEQNVRELIFEPLDMKHSGFDFNNLDEGIKAKGYQFLTAKQKKTYTYLDSTVSYSAGSIYSTTTDMYKWTEAIAKKQLLSSASWKYAFKRKADDYGFGFRINNFFGKSYIKHSGGYPGFVSEFIYYPKDKVTIILLKNSGDYGEDVWPVTMGLSNIVFGMPYDLWKMRVEIKLPDNILRQKEGKYAAGKISITFIMKDSQLYEILPNGMELPLFAESENSFYLQNFNTSLQFIKNSSGTIEKVIIHEHGKDIEAIKVQ